MSVRTDRTRSTEVHHAATTSAPRATTLGWVLAGVSTAAGLATLLWPGLLTGPAAMNGSAKGTALIVVVLAVPLLAVSLVRGLRGPLALVGGLGASAYLLYNAVLLTFGTPFNRAFLLYVAMIGLALWVFVLLMLEADGRPQPLARHHRVAAGWILVVVALNAAAWLGKVLPALVAEDPRTVLDGTGLTMSPVFVEDLAVWLPGLAWVAWRLWHHDPRAVLPAAGALIFWTIEGVGVAVDQIWGHAADPSSAVTSAALAPPFLAVSLVTAGVLGLLVRGLTGGVEGP